MKIIHTADWHLGNTFHRHDREEEFIYFLQWLLNTIETEQPDALLIAGDVFDTPNVSARATELFYDFLNDATEKVAGLQIVVIAGNHDSGGRLEAPKALLKRRNIYLRGLVRQNEDEATDYEHYILPLSEKDSSEAKVVCFAIPYLRSGDYPSNMTIKEGLQDFVDGMTKQLKKTPFKRLPIVACAHYYASNAILNEEEHSERLVIGGQDCVDGDLFNDAVSYVALGHIHRQQKINEHTYYAGSALPMSFTEKHYKHGVNCIEIDDEGNCQIKQLHYSLLRPLISLPDKGSASPKEILDLIGQLPKRKKNDDGKDWPYLEIRILEEEPEPELLHTVTEALAEKAVHFCRMIRDHHRSTTHHKEVMSDTKNRKLTPIELAEKVHEDLFNTPLRQELKERFEQATREALEERVD